MLHSAAPLITRTLDENIELSITCCGHLRPVHADPLQTETAILNLCINARDAMPAGGKLLIEATNTTVSEEESRRQPALRAGDYVRICVTDTGAGMVPEVAERIFEPLIPPRK
jgi:signal transduction histidine kinase